MPSKPIYCKIYPFLLAICYLEVIIWTSCLLASFASASASCTSPGHSYLLRETGNLKYAGNDRTTGLEFADLRSFDLHLQLEHLYQNRLLETLDFASPKLIQPGLSALRILSAPAGKVPLKPASDVVAGALARAASQSTIHPLDTLKVRLQAGRGVMPPGISKFGQLVPPAGASDRALIMMRSFGANVSGLYRGVVGAASGAGIAIGAYFAFYGATSNALSRHTDLAPPAIAFLAGGVAAAGSSVVKVPLAVCIRSVQAGVYPNFFAAANAIIAKAGPRGLFTGYLPTLLEDVPDMAVKFAAYESMRSLYRHLNNDQPASVQHDFVMGAAAGALAAAATTPLDVIKTNMMVTASSRPTMISVASQVFADGGVKAFFRGIGARAVSNGINSAVFFCFFEAIRGTFAERTRARTVARAQCVEIDVEPLMIDARDENLVAEKAIA